MKTFKMKHEPKFGVRLHSHHCGHRGTTTTFKKWYPVLRYVDEDGNIQSVSLRRVKYGNLQEFAAEYYAAMPR